MSKTLGLLDSLGLAEDGVSTAYPDTFADDIRGAYAEDFEIPAAKVAVLESDLAEAQAKILALQAHNYELMTAAPATDLGAGEEEVTDEETPEEDDDDNSGVDGLFTDKEEK